MRRDETGKSRSENDQKEKYKLTSKHYTNNI